MPDTTKLKSFAETAVKELQFVDTPPVIIARTLRLIESVVSRTERIIPAPANDDRPPLPHWGKRCLNQSEICTALGFWDTGLKPTLPERAFEAVVGDTQPG